MAQASESVRSASGVVIGGAVRSSGGPGERISYIDYDQGEVSFVISDAPSESTLDSYVKELQRYNVKHLVRVCDPTYSTSKINSVGVQVHDWPFKDGEAPPSAIVKKWNALLDSLSAEEVEGGPKPAIAIHCVAGLGRAPVLVAIGLIEQGMTPLDAIEFVRKKRRGAFNSKQITFLDGYKRQRAKKSTIRLSITRLFSSSRPSTPSPAGGASTPVAPAAAATSASTAALAQS